MLPQYFISTWDSCLPVVAVTTLMAIGVGYGIPFMIGLSDSKFKNINKARFVTAIMAGFLVFGILMGMEIPTVKSKPENLLRTTELAGQQKIIKTNRLKSNQSFYDKVKTNVRFKDGNHYRLMLTHVTSADGEKLPDIRLGTMTFHTHNQPASPGFLDKIAATISGDKYNKTGSVNRGQWQTTTSNGKTFDAMLQILSSRLQKVYALNNKSVITHAKVANIYAVNHQLTQIDFQIKMPNDHHKMLIVTTQAHPIKESQQTKTEIIKLKAK